MIDKPAEQQGQVTFEQALDQLEAIVRQLESGEVSLQDSMELFEKGVSLAALCNQQLDLAEGRLQLLLEKQGNVLRETLDNE